MSAPTTPENLEGLPSEFTTPETNPNYEIKTSESIKDNVHLASPNGARCLVTNKTYPIRHCHCIPRKFMKKEAVLTKLEWYWNMRKGTLNLDSRYNIFCGDPIIHCTFDDNKWLLLPEESVVRQFKNACFFFQNRRICERNLFPVFPEGHHFFYTFVHLQGMEKLFISLEDVPHSSTHHAHPFNTLPPLESHLHPKFVIFNCGQKLGALSRPLYGRITGAFPTLIDIEFVYKAWTEPPEVEAMKIDATYNTPVAPAVNDDDDGYDDIDDPKDKDFFDVKSARASQKASVHRQLPDRAAKRRNLGRGMSTPNREALSEVISNTFNKPLLSEVRLSRHNGQVGETRWTADRIRQWAKPFRKKRKLNSSHPS